MLAINWRWKTQGHAKNSFVVTQLQMTYGSTILEGVMNSEGAIFRNLLLLDIIVCGESSVWLS
jgi:hypothetical protein